MKVALSKGNLKRQLGSFLVMNYLLKEKCATRLTNKDFNLGLTVLESAESHPVAVVVVSIQKPTLNPAKDCPKAEKMLSPLEKWATARLEALGVDGVFAPYIVGMLSADSDDDPEDVQFNIHQVLMGWLSPEDEDKAHEFVEDLAKFFANPSLLAAGEAASAAMAVNDFEHDDAFMSKIAHSIIDDEEDAGSKRSQRNQAANGSAGGVSLLGARRSSKSAAGFHDILAEDGELKADAPLFVPGGTSKYTPPNSTGDDSDEDPQDGGVYGYGYEGEDELSRATCCCYLRSQASPSTRLQVDAIPVSLA